MGSDGKVQKVDQLLTQLSFGDTGVAMAEEWHVNS